MTWSWIITSDSVCRDVHLFWLKICWHKSKFRHSKMWFTLTNDIKSFRLHFLLQQCQGKFDTLWILLIFIKWICFDPLVWPSSCKFSLTSCSVVFVLGIQSTVPFCSSKNLFIISFAIAGWILLIPFLKRYRYCHDNAKL